MISLKPCLQHNKFGNDLYTGELNKPPGENSQPAPPGPKNSQPALPDPNVMSRIQVTVSLALTPTKPENLYAPVMVTCFQCRKRIPPVVGKERCDRPFRKRESVKRFKTPEAPPTHPSQRDPYLAPILLEIPFVTAFW